MGQLLEPQVDFEPQVGPRHRRTNHSPSVAGAEGVEFQHARPGDSAEPLLEPLLDAGLPEVVESNGPDDVRGDRALRVVALALGLEVKMLEIQGADAFEFRKRDQALDPLEASTAQALQNLRPVDAEHALERSREGLLFLDPVGEDTDGLHRRAEREIPAVAV